MLAAKFRIINSELSGREITLPDHPVIVGRGSNSDIVIPDQSVSRQHVRVEVRDGHCLLTDLGSHNGIVTGGRTVREAVLASGDRFELGDVAIEFLLAEVPAGPAPTPPRPSAEQSPPGFAVPEGYELARPAAAPAERPVYVDEVFGPAAAVEEAGPGEEELAAVAGARGAAKYIALLIIILAIGGVAWHLAGRSPVQPNVRHVIVQARERKVIDLGLATRTEGGRTVAYIDGEDVYDEVIDPGDEGIAVLELDPSGFMATVEGVSIGETDVKLLGANNRRAIVRILVRGVIARPEWEERLTPEERLGRGKQLIRDGRAAMNAGHIYVAKRNFREATLVLEAVRDTEGTRLRQEADDLFDEARRQLEEKFREQKNRALARLRSGDRVGAWAVWQQLLNEVPDPEDELNQKLRIIYERTTYEIQRKGG